MFFNQLKLFLYSTFRIIFSSYHEKSLSKSYRIGNRLLRANYCNFDGIAFSEDDLFSSNSSAKKFHDMPEHIYSYTKGSCIENIISEGPTFYVNKRLNADVFYRLANIEAQKTPH